MPPTTTPPPTLDALAWLRRVAAEATAAADALDRVNAALAAHAMPTPAALPTTPAGTTAAPDGKRKPPHAAEPMPDPGKAADDARRDAFAAQHPEARTLHPETQAAFAAVAEKHPDGVDAAVKLAAEKSAAHTAIKVGGTLPTPKPRTVKGKAEPPAGWLTPDAWRKQHRRALATMYAWINSGKVESVLIGNRRYLKPDPSLVGPPRPVRKPKPKKKGKA